MDNEDDMLIHSSEPPSTYSSEQLVQSSSTDKSSLEPDPLSLDTTVVDAATVDAESIIPASYTMQSESMPGPNPSTHANSSSPNIPSTSPAGTPPSLPLTSATTPSTSTTPSPAAPKSVAPSAAAPIPTKSILFPLWNCMLSLLCPCVAVVYIASSFDLPSFRARVCLSILDFITKIYLCCMVTRFASYDSVFHSVMWHSFVLLYVMLFASAWLGS
ncbi:uncharacterized protein EV420DRAFT_1543727 [Desarmillaria tabescens]|uniref:Uncharacterized protein n=1 Tax=Armillaria tabescens TaxID=1929756 RepID=A0AA39KE00_ARMTA|nr:uncharacterized protein EV420DRAFT_1543727 [Desarmillaria tabescens]KAK0458141.1 hypothetical protein EV420DRAFT_1543727 [Desarmillaria tabescens]